MPIDKRKLEWKSFTKKEILYREYIHKYLEENNDNAFTFLELCGEIHRRIGKDNVKIDDIFEGNMRAALQDPTIAIVFHDGKTYYALKDKDSPIK